MMEDLRVKRSDLGFIGLIFIELMYSEDHSKKSLVKF